MSGFQLVIGQPAPASATATGGIRTGFEEVEDVGYEPRDTTAEIWMKSDVIWGNQGGQQYQTTTDCGDDDGEGTEADPIRSFEELERRLRAGFGQGCHVKVFLMGHGGPDFDHPTEGRLYFTRDVRISYGNGSPESYRVNISYVGPRGMLPQAGPYKLSSASDVSNGSRRIGKTRLAFTLGGFAASVSAATYQLRWLRTDGREVIAPFGVEKNNVDGSVHTSIAAAATINGYANLSTDDWYVVIPAVAIATDDLDAQFRGVHIVGNGPYRVGDRESANSPPFDLNQWPHFERVAFVGRTTVNVVGNLMMDGCNFRDDLHVGPTTELRPRNNCIEGILYYNGLPIFRTAAAQFDPRLDPSCRLLDWDPDLALDTQRNTLTSDPDDAVTGQDWSISGQGSAVVIGEDVGGYGAAAMRVLKGVALNCEQGGSVAFKVYGSLYFANASRCCVTAIDSSGIMFWAAAGGRIRTNDGPCAIVQGGTPVDFAEFAGPCHYGSTNDVKVGNETTVAFGTAAGQFREVAGINGNYVSDYDYSRAWAPSSEPSTYGKAGG